MFFQLTVMREQDYISHKHVYAVEFDHIMRAEVFRLLVLRIQVPQKDFMFCLSLLHSLSTKKHKQVGVTVHMFWQPLLKVIHCASNTLRFYYDVALFGVQTPPSSNFKTFSLKFLTSTVLHTPRSHTPCTGWGSSRWSPASVWRNCRWTQKVSADTASDLPPAGCKCGAATDHCSVDPLVVAAGWN